MGERKDNSEEKRRQHEHMLWLYAIFINMYMKFILLVGRVRVLSCVCINVKFSLGGVGGAEQLLVHCVKRGGVGCTASRRVPP